MKSFLAAVCLLFTAACLRAAPVAAWHFIDGAPRGLVFNRAQAAFKPAPERTPDGRPAGEFTVLKTKPDDVAHGIQIGFETTMTLTPGTRYRYAFQIKGNGNFVLPFNGVQNQSPWKSFGNAYRDIRVNPDWQTVRCDFTPTLEWDGPVKLMFMPGKLPVGSAFTVGPVTLEILAAVRPARLDGPWTLFLNPALRDAELNTLADIPQTLGGVSPQTVTLENNMIDFDPLAPDFKHTAKIPAVLMKEITADEAGIFQIGCAADWWFEFIVNGRTAYDTLQGGNADQTFAPANHVFNFPLKKGRNLIAVRVLSGSAGWKFFCGTVPLRSNPRKKNSLYRIVRGPEWRPVRMDPVRWVPNRPGVPWTDETLKPKRVDLFKRIPGSALDLSQYVRPLNIDRNGRITANAQGQLVFENAPGLPVRLRGFNFIPHEWSHAFYRFTKDELAEYADEIARAGMNVLRFHFLDSFLAGHGGYPKQGKDRKPLTAVQLPQSVNELLKGNAFNPEAADRFHFFLKCLRDRGIYVMLDIVTSHGLFTEAVKMPDETEYPRFAMFHSETYRKHWKAGFDFLLKHPNPYTRQPLLDDPQLIGITFYNEQEHLFNPKPDGPVSRFTPLWKQSRGPGAPDFSFALLAADSPDGHAARQFLREQIRRMNDFYLGVVRESGFKGFVTNWDMYMRNLEGDARADFNAVAMHTYHAHPNQAPLKPASYKQSLNYGAWFRNIMVTSSQDSSISHMNQYIARAAVTRVLGKPFFMTEYSHCPNNRFTHEAAPMWAAFAALQDWQLLAPHANTVKLYYQPQKAGFDGAENLAAVDSSLFCAFGWQRGDIRSAEHAVSFYVPETVLQSPAYVGSIGSAANALTFLTRIGSDYRNPKNPAATHHAVPTVFSEAVHKGMYVLLQEDAQKNFFGLREQVRFLRDAGILPPGNRTDVNAGIFQSETGEICTDTIRHTLTVDAPRFQAAVLKDSQPVELSALAVHANSIPCTIGAISLENDRPVREARRLLLAVLTLYRAENSVFSGEDFAAELDFGDMQTLIRAGQFDLSLKTAFTRTPKLYALNRNGSRDTELPLEFNPRTKTVRIRLDTSLLRYGTPYFELVEDNQP